LQGRHDQAGLIAVKPLKKKNINGLWVLLRIRVRSSVMRCQRINKKAPSCASRRAKGRYDLHA